jgi:hypothetical protein
VLSPALVLASGLDAELIFLFLPVQSPVERDQMWTAMSCGLVEGCWHFPWGGSLSSCWLGVPACGLTPPLDPHLGQSGGGCGGGGVYKAATSPVHLPCHLQQLLKEGEGSSEGLCLEGSLSCLGASGAEANACFPEWDLVLASTCYSTGANNLVACKLVEA